MSDITPSEKRVAEALAAENHTGQITYHDIPTKTAEQAAEAVGCDVAQIVKSLIFEGAETGEPWLILVSGANRVHEKRVGRLIGEKLKRCGADYVRAKTGFAIGGVSPMGSITPIRTAIDEKLFESGEIWCAAGSPRSVFPITAQALMAMTKAQKICVT
ncbi:MAG: YbaK/EbsC family protein [Rhizobiaceae bacterium]